LAESAAAGRWGADLSPSQYGADVLSARAPRHLHAQFTAGCADLDCFAYLSCLVHCYVRLEI
jgi:hypothetical protein